MLIVFLLVLAVVLFFLAMLNTPAPPRFNLGWGGMFCLGVVLLIKHGVVG